MVQENGRGGGRELPLRERKKRETRQRISDVATGLFKERGFEKVTVAEIARGAGVSAMTVFNYFPRKEDLFLDRIPEAVETFAGAVRHRGPDETPLAALRRVTLDLVDREHPFSGVRSDFAAFFQVVLDSPALRARAREGVEEIEEALVRALEETAPEVEDPRLLATLTVAAYRAVFVGSARRLLAGEEAEAVAEDHRGRVAAAFGMLERVFG
ncbi:TetR/AcrR family transcriptional regulator [Streptomyces sp. 7R007]